jgi:nucleoside-diphosphate-sugar epimerase
LENPAIPSGIYNIADDEAISTNKLVEIIGETISKPAKILNTPKFIIKLLAKIGDLLPFPINSERLQKLTESYQVSNDKIKKAIQKDLPLSVEKGIQKTISSL